jgi:rhodanese-related sulfurtransferase
VPERRRRGRALPPLAEPKKITPREAWALIESGREPVFLDTRNPRHWEQSEHQLPHTLRIWRLELEERIAEVPRGRPVVTYCNCHYEHSSTRAALILEEYDFTEVYILVGGIKAWQAAGLPLEKKSSVISCLSSVSKSPAEAAGFSEGSTVDGDKN